MIGWWLGFDMHENFPKLDTAQISLFWDGCHCGYIFLSENKSGKQLSWSKLQVPPDESVPPPEEEEEIIEETEYEFVPQNDTPSPPPPPREIPPPPVPSQPSLPARPAPSRKVPLC